MLKGLSLRGEAQEALFDQARTVRNAVFGPIAEVRSVVEYANLCDQECRYCGMWNQSGVARYILSSQEFASQVGRLYDAGRRVIMVQTGECGSRPYFERLVGDIEAASHRHPGVKWIFAFGSLDFDSYRRLRRLGPNRYLLKFEASRPGLYAKVKPSDTLSDRLQHIYELIRLGFEVSTGNITGLPSQTLDDLVDDLLLTESLGVVMGSTSPFVPNEMSAYANRAAADADTTLNYMALLRILCPEMLIPATSALEMVCKDGQYRGLMAGANVVTFHDGTPACQEEQFLLYRKERHLPKDNLLSTLERAGLRCTPDPLEPGAVQLGEDGA